MFAFLKNLYVKISFHMDFDYLLPLNYFFWIIAHSDVISLSGVLELLPGPVQSGSGHGRQEGCVSIPWQSSPGVLGAALGQSCGLHSASKGIEKNTLVM